MPRELYRIRYHGATAICRAAGDEFTAEDFRTGRAAAELAKLDRPETKRAGERAVADALGNTPAVCRKSCVHPWVVEVFLADRFLPVRGCGGLTADEVRALRVVSGSKSV